MRAAALDCADPAESAGYLASISGTLGAAGASLTAIAGTAHRRPAWLIPRGCAN